MTLIGGRSGLLTCPEGYHILDTADTKQLLKLTSPSNAANDKNKMKIKTIPAVSAIPDSSKDAEGNNNNSSSNENELDAAISQEEAALVAQFEGMFFVCVCVFKRMPILYNSFLLLYFISSSS